MVTLGSKNSRMRDFFDIRALAAREAFEGRSIARAISTTFEKRSTPVPEMPLALTRGLADVEGKRDQWNAFLRKNGLAHTEFGDVLNEVSAFLLPVIGHVVAGRVFDRTWPPGGPWV